MPNQKRIIFSWSGGKDSALALWQLLQDDNYVVEALVCSLEGQSLSSSVHQIPLAILQEQAQSIGLPLYTFELMQNLQDYEAQLSKVCNHFKSQGITAIAYGDLSSSGIMPIRQAFFNAQGIEVICPLWGKESNQVMSDFLKSGIKAKIIVGQCSFFDKHIIGKDLDVATVQSFPTEIDLCGELGEYHSIAYAGPLFKENIKIRLKDVVKKSYTIATSTQGECVFDYWQAVL